MTSLTWDRHQGHAFTYDVVTLGFNYRIDELRAAIGIRQLEKLPHNNQRRKEITHGYWHAFHSEDISLPFRQFANKPDIESAYHLFPILLPQHVNRLSFMQHLREAGIQSSIHYPPIHQFSFYKNRYPETALKKTEEYAAREVTLPLFPGMSFEQRQAVTDTVRQALKK